jgi:hypothetical protein
MMERITFGYLITAVMLILPAIVFVLMIRPTFSTASLRLSMCGLLMSMIPNIMGSLLRGMGCGLVVRAQREGILVPDCKRLGDQVCFTPVT